MKALLVLLLLLLTFPARADLRTDSPAAVTRYLEPMGLKVDAAWRKAPGKGWSASSRSMDLSRDSENRTNNLKVQYEGHETRVTRATLLVTISVPADELKSLNTFVDAATKLSRASSGIPLSQAMHDAIRSNKPYTETVNGYRFSTDHISLVPTGAKYYVVRLIVQSEAGGFPADDPPAVPADRVKES